jgi:hypothetical protein
VPSEGLLFHQVSPFGPILQASTRLALEKNFTLKGKIFEPVGDRVRPSLEGS